MRAVTSDVVSGRRATARIIGRILCQRAPARNPSRHFFYLLAACAFTQSTPFSAGISSIPFLLDDDPIGSCLTNLLSPEAVYGGGFPIEPSPSRERETGGTIRRRAKPKQNHQTKVGKEMQVSSLATWSSKSAPTSKKRAGSDHLCLLSGPVPLRVFRPPRVTGRGRLKDNVGQRGLGKVWSSPAALSLLPRYVSTLGTGIHHGRGLLLGKSSVNS